MRCDFCEGTGVQVSKNMNRPCEECGGFGILHCCEGLVACPQFGKTTSLDTEPLKKAIQSKDTPG